MDIQILTDLFGNYLDAEKKLGMDSDFGRQVLAARKRLAPPAIGKDGTLQEWTEDLAQMEDKHRHFSHMYGLYPGNVMRLNWEIADLLVVVGRVQDRDGNPIANAVIESAQGLASTDDFGYFQAEVKLAASADGVLLEFRDSDGLCRVLVPEFEKRAGVGFLDTLVCRRLKDSGKER